MTTGIDVYWGNGDVDFTPYDFAILQAYDGHTGLQADAHGDWYTRHANAVRDQGIPLMTYLWLSPKRPVLDQVDRYLDQVRGWPTLFHWVDYEERGLDPSMSDDALALLPANSGVYSNGGQYPGGRADERPWWGAGYPHIVDGPPNPVLHQYADAPHDMNVVVDHDWYARVTGGAPTPAKPAAPKPPREDPDMLLVIQSTTPPAQPVCTVFVANGSAPVAPAQAWALAAQGVPHLNDVPALEALSLARGLDPVGFARAFPGQ